MGVSKISLILYAVVAVAVLLVLFGSHTVDPDHLSAHSVTRQQTDLNHLRSEISKALELVKQLETTTKSVPVSVSVPEPVEASSPIVKRSMPGVDPSVIAKSDVRLAHIRSQTYNSNNPYYQSKRTDLFIYPATPYPKPFRTNDDINAAVNSFHALAQQKVQSKGHQCPICVEHFKTAEELWDKFIKPRYYSAKTETPYVGTYVEMGALDGLVMANTLFFDHALHWNGLLIEPSPPNYANLVVNRPNSMKAEVASCVCNAPPLNECDLQFVGNGGSVGGGTDSLEPREKKLGNPKPKVTYNVNCAPMSEIFLRAGVTRVDFWSLDNEGAELITLQTVDWSAVQVHDRLCFIPCHTIYHFDMYLLCLFCPGQVWLLLVEFNPIFDNGPAMTAELQKAGFKHVLNMGNMNQLWENPNYHK